ncbi:eukaryotic initiation factor 4e, putative [Acanthamoeba castellanii str. Neff]|uniref:Eukaryotic initiation factor 4e, putative n=1 Tax=Acanthamoeba castellanii (strain ATCC 30010 / Neff) TaxID=1257118 RepID=L8H4Z1_ACACF|nr:eukaryotic initiation factor 4e, putative [Acanthamoeba castellanii str. Neff]ELR20240.1 eukaryotic initiation factor 4e, putative [Acanthamoeba castellanii str. Neff]
MENEHKDKVVKEEATKPVVVESSTPAGAESSAATASSANDSQDGSEGGEGGNGANRSRRDSDAARRSRSNSAKAWKVKGAEGASPATAPAQSANATKADATLGAAAAVLATPTSPAASHQQHKQPQHKPRSRKGSRAGQLESPRSDAPAHDDGASILGHRLQTPWTFWFSRKDRRRSNSITAGPSGTVVIDKKLDKKEHMEHLVQIGTCRTVEEFWHHYAFIQRASNLPKESNLYFFRNQLKPMWETFPKGGCFIVRVDKRTGALDKMWEELLFASIGELFEDPNVVGVEVSIRSKEDGLSVWTKTNQKHIRLSIGEKLKLMLDLDDVMYKSNSTSIKDRSTYKNAQKVLVAS